MNTDFSLISDPQNEEGSVKIKPISIPESSTGADLPNFFLARTHPFSEGCQISVQVYKIIASNLRNTEIVGQIDPYISLSLNNGYWSALTSVLTNAGPDMEWNINDMRFIISIHQLKSSVLTVQAFDSNTFEKDRIIGSGEMTMADGAFTAVDGLKLTIPLKEKAGLDSGTLIVVLRLAVSTEDRKTNASNVEVLLLSDSKHSSEVAESLKQHEIVKDAISESPAKEASIAGISLELSLPQLQLQIPTTDANSYEGAEKQNQGFPSNQFTSEKLKDMMEDATFRAILFADSENKYPWNGNVLKLMKTAASKSILSAQFDDNDSVDSKGCAKGFGYKSVTAGLKIADLRMKIRASGSSSALRRSMGVDAVRRLSSFVNSPKSTAMLAATATAAVSALSPSRKQQSLQSEEELQNIINSVLADLRRSFNTMVLDYSDDNTSVGTAESHKSKAGRSRSSSWKLDQADSAIGSSADSEMDPGNSSIMKIGKQKLQRCSSAPSKSLRNFAQSVSPRNAYTSENNILRLLHVSQGKNILQMMHRAPEKNIFKIIQSENFIESSIYQWAKPKKSGVNPPHLRKSIKAGKGKSTAKSNNVSELDDEHSGKKSTTKTPQQPKKQAPTKTQTAAVSLKMTSPIFYKKKRLMEAAQFAKSVVENSEEAQWDASGTLSPPPVARFRIIKLLGNTGDDRSDHDMKVSKATENDADNLKQAMAELEQITLRDIMRPLPDLRKNMVFYLDRYLFEQPFYWCVVFSLIRHGRKLPQPVRRRGRWPLPGVRSRYSTCRRMLSLRAKTHQQSLQQFQP